MEDGGGKDSKNRKPLILDLARDKIVKCLSYQSGHQALKVDGELFVNKNGVQFSPTFYFKAKWVVADQRSLKILGVTQLSGGLQSNLLRAMESIKPPPVGSKPFVLKDNAPSVFVVGAVG